MQSAYILVWPPDLLYSSVISFIDCRSRAVSAHINCTCALCSLGRKHSTLHIWTALDFQLWQYAASPYYVWATLIRCGHISCFTRGVHAEIPTPFSTWPFATWQTKSCPSSRFCDIPGTLFWRKLCCRSRNYSRVMAKYDTGIWVKCIRLHIVFLSFCNFTSHVDFKIKVLRIAAQQSTSLGASLPQLAKTLAAHYATWNFIIVSTRACHLLVPSAILIQSTHSYPIPCRCILKISSHLRLGFSSVVFSGPHETPPIRATHVVHLVLFDLVT